jgi:hypothetical protein
MCPLTFLEIQWSVGEGGLGGGVKYVFPKIVIAKVWGDFGGGWTVGADSCQVPSLTLKSKQKKANVFPHHVAWVRVRRGIDSAWKSLRKFVTPELFQRINAIKNKHWIVQRPVAAKRRGVEANLLPLEWVGKMASISDYTDQS